MQIIQNPERKEWDQLLKRPYVDNRALLESVQAILNAVREHGDEALRSFTKKFDGVESLRFEIEESEMEEAGRRVAPALQKAIRQAAANVEAFHKKQLAGVELIETMPGISCWRKNVGIERVGLYVPGGTAPLFSTVIMLGIPARLAGCREIILCTPPDKNGEVHPAVLFTARLVGITRVFRIGGAQAIAAMAFGTTSIPPVYKIFGPGNQYVTAAKQLVQMQGVAIDMPAGPSEVCVIADETANASFVAADLLSQAEHGADSQVMLVSANAAVVQKIKEEMDRQIAGLPRKEIAEKALKNSKAIVLNNAEEVIDLVNAYAAEHLIISCKEAEAVAERIVNAGSVFIGNYSPESVGDYASGTNHTLPTNGFARAYSGVSVDSFVKKITFQKLSEEGLKNIAATVISMAEAEGLQAHANAVSIRLEL
jgi:histidinol dehydrogenase